MKKLLLVLLALPLIGFGQNVNIPDAAFKAYLLGNTAINTNGDTEIQVSEAAAFTGAINFYNPIDPPYIYNLTGIEAFTALTELNCEGNQLTSLNVSQNTALTYLRCGGNQLTSLDISGATALTYLNCGDNYLTSLDISGATALTYLNCGDNYLSSLNVSQNTALTYLGCGGNPLTSLDVSQNNALTYLYCGFTSLSSLDVSQNTALTELYCEYNQLTSLDVRNGNNTNFQYIYASSNPNLYCIDVDDDAFSTFNWTGSNFVFDSQSYFSNNCSAIYGCTDSTAFNYNAAANTDDGSCYYYATYVPDNNFEAYLEYNGMGNGIPNDDYVNTANINTVNYLDVSYQNIADLTGIEAFAALTYLLCWDNQLTSLNVSQNTALTYLNCRSNQLTSLNVSQNNALTQLRCMYNQLTSLNVSGATALTSLLCWDNQLTSLDVSQNTALDTLDCGYNQLTSLDVSQNTALTLLDCRNNQLTSLNVGQNTDLTYLNCSYNQLTSLNVGQNTDLTILNCEFNLLTSLDVRNGNNLNLYAFNTLYNTNLYCISVDNAAWATANLTAANQNIDPQSYFSNNCNPIYGCTDLLACNYDALADTDDGSCIYQGQAPAQVNCWDNFVFNTTTCFWDNIGTPLLASISQTGDSLFAVTNPIGLNANWYNIQTEEDTTTRIWLMETNASSFTPTFDCSYFIVVSHNGCEATSLVYDYGANAARIGSFTTFPNPTSGVINVKFENSKNQFVMFDLISNNGTKLDEFITIEDNLNIDLSKYSSGTYYLYFNSEDAVQGCRLEEVQKISTKIILNK